MVSFVNHRAAHRLRGHTGGYQTEDKSQPTPTV
jgi:hypothetical protein